MTVSATATPKAASDTVYGKQVSELQSNVVVNSDAILGTLHYVTGYTGFNGSEVDEQSGNYLALDFDWEPTAGSTMTVELVGGEKGPVTLTDPDDKFCVFRITDETSQSIKVKVTDLDSGSYEHTYSLEYLTLEPAPEE